MNKNSVVHGLFELTIGMKAISGLVEIISGSLLFFVPHTRVMGRVSYNTQYFVAIYLLFYGVVNIFLVLFLWRGKLWAYPTAIICFSLFTSYMFVRFLHTHSLLLLVFAVYDVVLIILTDLEYRRIKVI